MSLRLHSTLTGVDEPVVPGPDGVIGIYACGPTVYSRIHIGNARPFVVFSVLKRYLERRGARARLVINVTDVNDKIYDAARAEGIPSTELAERDPVDGSAEALREVFEFGKRLLFRGHHGDLVALGARRLEHEKRKPPVARDEPQLHSSTTGSSVRRVERRRITPRRDVRMKSTR